jgi:hypothetical protein
VVRGGLELVRAEAIELPDSFGAVQHTTFDHSLRLTPSGLASLASSWSYVAVRPDRDQVLAQVAATGRRVAGADGTLTLPLVTYCYRAVKRST